MVSHHTWCPCMGGGDGGSSLLAPIYKLLLMLPLPPYAMLVAQGLAQVMQILSYKMAARRSPRAAHKIRTHMIRSAQIKNETLQAPHRMHF